MQDRESDTGLQGSTWRQVTKAVTQVHGRVGRTAAGRLLEKEVVGGRRVEWEVARAGRRTTDKCGLRADWGGGIIPATIRPSLQSCIHEGVRRRLNENSFPYYIIIFRTFCARGLCLVVLNKAPLS